MTSEEIIQGLYRGDSKALDMAIKALEQQQNIHDTCKKCVEFSEFEQQESEDCISREAVEKITWEEPSYDDALNVLTEVRDKVRALPSVTPSRPRGKWIRVGKEDGFPIYKCDQCGCLIFSDSEADRKKFHSWCGACGADMR